MNVIELREMICVSYVQLSQLKHIDEYFRKYSEVRLKFWENC